MNTYRPVDGYVLLYSIDDYENINKIFIPYWEPPSFIPSNYSPYEILISTNPSGSEGPLSQDSYMVRLAAESLRDAFQARISAEIFQNTIGQVNLQSLQDPFNASLLITGQQPLVYQNWRITVPENPVLRAVDLATRLASAYWPVSPIPGDYFDENPPNSQSPQTTNALNVVNQLTGGFLGPILNITRNPSEILLANTGNAQRSSLFNNISVPPVLLPNTKVSANVCSPPPPVTLLIFTCIISSVIFKVTSSIVSPTLISITSTISVEIILIFSLVSFTFMLISSHIVILLHQI
jgi:hypothetical protein